MKKLIFKLPLLLMLLSASLFAQSLEDTPEAAKAYNEGNQLRKSGNYQGAAEAYNKALELSKDYRLYYQLGLTYKSMRDYTKAADTFNKGLEASPEYAPFYNAIGGIYFVQGEFQKAIDSFKKFEELAEKESHKDRAGEYIARAYAKLGLTAKNQGNFDQAQEYFQAAVDNHPLDAAYLGLAEVYVEQGEFQKALEAADNAINNRKSISKGAAYYYKGLAFKGLDQKQKAIENFEISVKDAQYKTVSKYHLDLLK